MLFAAWALLGHASFAADQYWDVNGVLSGLGGTGTWDTSALNLVWNNSSGTGLPSSWTNGNNAFFNGTAGTVTVGSGVSAARLTLGVSGYTISGSNALTLTGTGTGSSGAISANNSSGTNTISAPVNLGASSGSTQTLNQTSGGTLVVSGAISSTNSVTVSVTGGGTVRFSNTNMYSGATNISSATLEAAAAGALGSTSAITINSGGTLLLSNSGTSDHINNAASITLNGGTLNTGGVSEHGAANNTPGLGVLTLQTYSIIDMASGASIIAFTDSHLASWSGSLAIYNWSGTPKTGSGTDRLYFGADTSGLSTSQL